MIKIITDSTCNLDDELLTRHDIRVAPIAIQFGDETFEEGIDIDRDAFYARIDRTGRIPTTSQPRLWAASTTARITALSPGASPQPVLIRMRRIGARRLLVGFFGILPLPVRGPV